MIRTQLGRITQAHFGFGGYDGGMLGLSFSFGGPAWGVGTFIGAWATHSEHCVWTVAEQHAEFAAAVVKLGEVLTAAKKMDIAELVGVPVEVTLEGNQLSDWRVLTEVIG